MKDLRRRVFKCSIPVIERIVPLLLLYTTLTLGTPLSITTVGTQSVVRDHHTHSDYKSSWCDTNTERTKTMYDLFYIVETHDHWYNLRLKETHYCIACGDSIDPMLNTIGLYVKKYKTAERVYKMIRGLSDSGRMSPMTLDNYQKEFAKGGWKVFDDLIRNTVTQARQEDKKNSPFNRAKRSVRTVEKDLVETPPVQEVVVSPIKKVTPHKIKRTLCPAH